MGEELGGLLAQNYLLPQRSITPQAPAPKFQDEIGAPEDSLQQIDGVTGAYFDKWAALKGFARDVFENYGIDVRYPDPSVPESNRLHRIYLKSLADLKKQGSALKVGQQMYSAALNRGDIINIDPRQQNFSEASPMDDFMPNELDPIVTEANNKLEQLYFGDAVNEARAYRAEVEAMLKDKIKNNPNQARYWQRQLDALIQPTKAVREFNPNTGGWSNYQRGRIKASETFLKKMTNLQKGTADSYQLSEEVFGPNNERVWVSEDTKGEKYGGRSIVRYEYTPSLKKTEVVVRDNDGNISRIDITDSDPMSHAKGYMDNSKYAANGEWLDIAAEEMGYLNPETGEVNYGNLLAKDADQRFEKMSKQESAAKSKQSKTKVKMIEDKLADMIPSEQGGALQFRDDRYGFNIKDGKQFVVAARNAGDGKSIVYEITNAKEIWPGQTKDFYARMKKLDKTKMRNLLINNSAHELFEGTGTESVATPSVQTDRKKVL